jgi:hypothetical protein
MKAVLAALCIAAPLAAQDAQVRAPLRPLADHPAPVLPAPPFPALLIEASPAVGLFRSAGLPAGLPRDVTASRGVLSIGMTHDGGSYRRPFDPDDATAVTVRAAGWQPLGGHGAAWGRVVAENTGLGTAGFASHFQPYGSSPLVLADTSNPKVQRVRATLEGATGWAAGSWLMGVAAGLDVLDLGTRDAGFVRTNRASVPAVQLAFGRDMPGGLTLVLHGRWVGGSETMFLRPQPSPSRAYLFSGFDDPLPLDIASPNAFFRRTQRDAFEGGVGLAGRLFGGPWVLTAARTYRHDTHFSDVIANPPSDDWTADGWTILAEHQRTLPAGVTGTLHVEARRLVGDVTLESIEGVTVQVQETMLDAAVDLRWTPPRSAIQTALRLGLGMSHRQLDDYLVQVGADVEVWRPSAVAEVAYPWRNTAVALAAGVAGAGPYATLPRPSAMGPVYYQFIAPAWSRDATPAITLLGALTVRQTLSPGLALVAHAELTGLSPQDTPVVPSPSGSYREWRVSVSLLGAR